MYNRELDLLLYTDKWFIWSFIFKITNLQWCLGRLNQLFDQNKLNNYDNEICSAFVYKMSSRFLLEYDSMLTTLLFCLCIITYILSMTQFYNIQKLFSCDRFLPKFDEFSLSKVIMILYDWKKKIYL